MTTISPIRYAVEIQAPLSTPVPMPPSMSSSEALVIWMLRIAMNAPIMQARMATQSFVLARGVEAAAAVALAMARPSEPLGSIWMSVGEARIAGGRLGVDARRHAHAGPEIPPSLAVPVEHELDRDALDDLGEIAGSVIRRQQRKGLAAG